MPYRCGSLAKREGFLKMDITSPIFMFSILILGILLFAFPLLLAVLNFVLGNWLIVALIVGGIIAFYFVSKYLFSKGGTGHGQAFRGIP